MEKQSIFLVCLFCHNSKTHFSFEQRSSVLGGVKNMQLAVLLLSDIYTVSSLISQFVKCSKFSATYIGFWDCQRFDSSNISQQCYNSRTLIYIHFCIHTFALRIVLFLTYYLFYVLEFDICTSFYILEFDIRTSSMLSKVRISNLSA